MADLFVALVGPIAKLILKGWLGETSADIGSNLIEVARERLGERFARSIASNEDCGQRHC